MGKLFSKEQEEIIEEDFSISDFFKDDSSWDVERLEKIISKGVKLNEPLPSKFGTRPLHAAARRGDLNVVQTLLDHGAKVDIRDHNKESPLHIAAEAGHHETVKLLLNAGAAVLAKNCTGSTPLHKTKSCKVADILVKHGASVQEKNDFKLSPLHSIHIFESEESFKDITELLIDNGADVNELDAKGRTALHYAARNSLPSSLSVLISKGALLDVKDVDGWTPLFHAVDTDKPHNVECLLDNGASSDVKLNNGDTCVHHAAKNNSALSFTILAEKGAKLNAQNKHGWTALHIAAARDSRRIVAGLLAHGASVSVKNYKGKTPFQLVSERLHSKFMIASHILLSTLAGLPVSEDIGAKLNEAKTQEALQELQEITTTQLAGKFCLYDIFAKFKQPKYLLDGEVMESIETLFRSPDFQDQFPLYADILKGTIIRSKKSRYYLSRRAVRSMMSHKRISWCQKTPDLAWDQIVKYLSLEDLTNIIKSEI